MPGVIPIDRGIEKITPTYTYDYVTYQPEVLTSAKVGVTHKKISISFNRKKEAYFIPSIKVYSPSKSGNIHVNATIDSDVAWSGDVPSSGDTFTNQIALANPNELTGGLKADSLGKHEYLIDFSGVSQDWSCNMNLIISGKYNVATESKPSARDLFEYDVKFVESTKQPASWPCMIFIIILINLLTIFTLLI